MFWFSKKPTFPAFDEMEDSLVNQTTMTIVFRDGSSYILTWANDITPEEAYDTEAQPILDWLNNPEDDVYYTLQSDNNTKFTTFSRQDVLRIEVQ